MVDNKRISRLLSLMLRHRPDEFGLQLDEYGYVPLDEIVRAIRERYPELEDEEVERRIHASKAHRFEITDKGVRALYGHSFFIEMDGEPMEPPEFLYMASTQRDASRFKEEGIRPKDRFYVHLSLSRQVAESRSSHLTGPCVIEILAQKAAAEGVDFYERGEVVLARQVPAACLGEVYGMGGQDWGGAPEQGASSPTVTPQAMTYGRRPRKATGRR